MAIKSRLKLTVFADRAVEREENDVRRAADLDNSVADGRALAAVRATGASALLAINPATPVEVAIDVLDDIDGLLIMTVNPGFAGQSLVESTLNKIRRLRKYLDEAGYNHVEIEVDGNVSFENAKKMSEAGADIFVAGSSSVFSKAASLPENMVRLRGNIEQPSLL